MPNENPGAYNEARNRIKEKQEKEKESFEIRRKEEFESKKEKLYSKKHLDVFSLRRSIETGKSLNSLKEDIKKALDNGDITLDTYRDVIDTIEQEDNINIPTLTPSFVLDPRVFPFYESELSKFLDNQKLGKNIFFDFGGFIYGFAQGSSLLLYLMGKIILDTILLPKDIYTLIRNK